MGRLAHTATALFISLLLLPPAASAAERLCDASVENCRTPLLNLINAERVGIDVAFWFMEDTRYSTAIIDRFKAGVPVRVIMDTDANVNYPINAQILQSLKSAGIPMREKTSRGITHWKMMLFAGQNVVEFSSANFSPHAFVPRQPYVDYIDEVIYFSDDPSVVNSFKRKYDDVWITTSGFSNYANVTSLSRRYPLFEIDPELNFPPYESFQSRSVKAYDRETVGIDAVMFRIMDRAHVDGLIRALQRGARVRLLTEPSQYRDSTGSRIWHSWNVDRLYLAGKQRGVETVRHRKHLGALHEKATVLHGQKMGIFGSSNWTTSSSNAQLEHNYFTKKFWFYDWLRQNFNRKWNNSAGFAETQPFVPLPPDAPPLGAPANGATGQPTTLTLTWNGGPWAHLYDVEIGPSATALTPVARDLALGPSTSPTDMKKYTLSGLQPGTTYYWRIIGKTAALMTRASGTRSFTTQGTAPATTTSDAPDIVLHTANAVLRGAWQLVSDSSAASGRAAVLPDKGRAKVTTAVSSPADYFQLSFHAKANTSYRLWMRGRALSNQPSNDSVHVQFTDSVNSSGGAQWRIGTTSSMAVNLEHCSGCGIAGWGWQDNGWGSATALGPTVRFTSDGVKTIRVQNREDGFYIDQIVLSASTYLNKAPGANQNSRIILSPQGGTTTSTTSTSSAPDIVLHTANAVLRGAWQLVSDSSAASGRAAVLPDKGRAKVITASGSPGDYFQMAFRAVAGTAYRLWIRGRALNDHRYNDSVHVQFTDSLNGSGQAQWRIGTTSSMAVNLEHCSGCGISGWGWQDNGWGSPSAFGPTVRFASDGVKTIRVQNREDGFYIDQIVLSASTYLNKAPGANQNSRIVLSPQGGTTTTTTGSSTAPEIVLHTAAAALRGAWRLVNDATAASGKAAVLPDEGRAKAITASASPADYFQLAFRAVAGTAYRLWIRGRALRDHRYNDSVHVQFTDSVNGSGQARWRIGTTSSIAVNLEHCSGCGISGWGWQDNGWGSPTALGPTVRFASDGMKTIRVQNREDGFHIDQIVLSPSKYLFKAPGANQNSRIILEADSGG